VGHGPRGQPGQTEAPFQYPELTTETILDFVARVEAR
jgi:hypothetical protein